jgi:hypothetical protein
MKLNQTITKYAVAVALLLSVGSLMAQPGGAGGAGGAGGGGGRRGQGGPGGAGGNFDPAQMQQRIMDNYRQTLEITDDTEWSAIQPILQKVVTAQTAARAGGGFGGRGGAGGGRGGRGGANQVANPERDALQKAIDDNAPAGQVKDLLAKYQKSLKEKQAALVTAQADLRKVLSVRQEAQATLAGLLQ